MVGDEVDFEPIANPIHISEIAINKIPENLKNLFLPSSDKKNTQISAITPKMNRNICRRKSLILMFRLSISDGDYQLIKVAHRDFLKNGIAHLSYL
jgi:hypothetical protein